MTRERLFSVADAAELCAVPRSSLRYWIAQGDVPTVDGRVPRSALRQIREKGEARGDWRGRKPSQKQQGDRDDDWPEVSAQELKELQARVPATAEAAAVFAKEDDEDGPDPAAQACFRVEIAVARQCGGLEFPPGGQPRPMDLVRALAHAYAARLTLCGSDYQDEAKAMWRAVAALRTTTTRPGRAKEK